jgi:uncharacterized protein YbjT (DUF2867 family)
MGTGKRIAVVGASGRLGRPLVDVLGAAGHDVVAASRSSGVDVITGEGLAEALEGVESVVDVSTWPTPDQDEATRFFTSAARNLHQYGERAGVRRIVVVSIIGCDRFPSGYNVAKVVQERETLSGPIPAQVLRAAQFHEFVPLLMEWGRDGDVIRLPKMRTQLVAARTVAEALAEMATAPETAQASDASETTIPEIAGPREENLVEMAALVAARRGDPVKVAAVSGPADPERELMEGGAALPGPHATLAGPTFEEWLDSTPPR